jgi:hypothetical protein
MDWSEFPVKLVITIVIIAIVVFFIVRMMSTTPMFSFMSEGFFAGVTRGSGEPDSPRTLPEASQLLDILASRGVNSIPSGVSDASSNYSEFQLILSKLAALKQDLLSTSGVVNATRYQAFETSHDRINTAEVCAMCFTQSIPARDLDIVFITWRDRGRVLLRKLCTEANLSEPEVVNMEKQFNALWSDVYDIAKSRCLKTDFSLQNGGATGGDVGAYEPTQLKDLRSYENKYGGLSASGWNGTV